jgi:capsular polysaccharide biosynthesis protein
VGAANRLATAARTRVTRLRDEWTKVSHNAVDTASVVERLRERFLLHSEAPLPPEVPVAYVHANIAAGRLVNSVDEFLATRPPVRGWLTRPGRHSLRESTVRSLCYADPIPKCLTNDEYESEPYAYVRLRNARVHVRWGLVQVRPGLFLDESVHATRWLRDRLSHLSRDPVLGGGDMPMINGSGDVDHAITAEPARVLRGRHLLLNHWAAHNYGHFVMDCLPGPFVFRDQLAAGRMSLLARPLNDWQRRLLERLEIPAKAIEEVEDDVVAVEELIFPMSLTCCYTPNPGPLHRGLFRALAARPSPSAPSRIYVSRATRQGSRVMTNEAELCAELTARGFVPVDPGQLDIDQQAETFSRAEIIVGALGAGLTNIGFAPPGCAVIEILPDAVAETWIAHLSHVLGHRFVYIVAKAVDAKDTLWAGRPRTDVEFDYETPLPQTIAAVDEFLAS